MPIPPKATARRGLPIDAAVVFCFAMKGPVIMKILTKNIADLRPAAYNPRKTLAPGDEEYEQIKRSILAFGLVEPIVWNSQTGNVVAGHQRLTVLRDLGYDTVAVSVIDVTEAQEKALNIALNKISGQWDDNKLSILLEELSADDMLIDLTGFSQIELNDILNLDLDDGDDAEETPPSRESSFNYKEQFGVIVLCADEDEQKTVYETLVAQGYTCRVVAT